MNILYLSPWFPFPPTNGSELRINALVKGLAAAHEVTLISFQRREITDEALVEAQTICGDVTLVPWREFEPSSPRALLGFLSEKPRSVVDTYSSEMEAAVRDEVVSGQYDLIVMSELVPAAYLGACGGLPVVMDDLELGVIAHQTKGHSSLVDRKRKQLMWVKQCNYVRSILPRLAACTVVSKEERELLRDIAPDYKAVELLPNCVSVADYSDIAYERSPTSLAFTGAFTYRVNYDAMVWFIGEVLPLIRAEVPGAHLTITGNHAGLPLPSMDGVTLAGFVDDVKRVVAGASVAIVPILHGGGTRLKILEAMALRTPVVSTSKGAEGLDAVNRQHLIISDEPEAFAAAVVELLRNDSQRKTLAENAFDLVAREYNWASVMPRFLQLVERVAAEGVAVN